MSPWLFDSKATIKIKLWYIYLVILIFLIRTMFITTNSLNNTTKQFNPSSTFYTSEGESSDNGSNNSSENDRNENNHVHILYALSGNNSGVLLEFETSLKSVLLNSPFCDFPTTSSSDDCSMNIHIMADNDAYNILPVVWNRTGLKLLNNNNNSSNDSTEPIWWINVNIHTYHVTTEMEDKWRQYVIDKVGKINSHHTLGAYYRLFANDVILTNNNNTSIQNHSRQNNNNNNIIRHVIYLDTDVVFTSNIGILWDKNNRNDTIIWSWGKAWNSGLIVLNLNKLNDLWNHYIPTIGTPEIWKKNVTLNCADQSILVKVGEIYEEKVFNWLPEQYDINIGSHWMWRDNIIRERSNGVGMIHYNGGSSSKYHYFIGEGEDNEEDNNNNDNGTTDNNESNLKKEKSLPYAKTYINTWGIHAHYYTYLPWTWVLYNGKSNALQQQQRQKQSRINGRDSSSIFFPRINVYC